MVNYNLKNNTLTFPLSLPYLILYTTIIVLIGFGSLYTFWIASSEISACYCKAKCTDAYFNMCTGQKDFTSNFLSGNDYLETVIINKDLTVVVDDDTPHLYAMQNKTDNIIERLQR